MSATSILHDEASGAITQLEIKKQELEKQFAELLASIEQHQPYLGLTKLQYPIDETAVILSMSEKSVRRLIKRGLLQSNPALRDKRITRDSIVAFARMTTKI
jgi:hypothetical protein